MKSLVFIRRFALCACWAIPAFLSCPPLLAQQLLIALPPPPKLDPWNEFFAIGAAPEKAAVQRGKALFRGNCSFCHGANATGGNTGPSLVQSPIVLHDQGSGEALGRIVRAGRAAKGMPSFTLSDSQILDIAAFLYSRYQSVMNRMTYQTANLVTGDAVAGEAYFRSKCVRCHSPHDDLAHVATKWDAPTLQQKFLYPAEPFDSPESGAPQPTASATLTLASGEVIRGELIFRDDFRVTLRVMGENRVFDFDDGSQVRLQVVDRLAGHETLLSKYTDADMHNVLAYLETLR